MIVALTATDAELLDRAARRFEDGTADPAYLAGPGTLAFVAVPDDDPAGEPRGWCWGYRLPRPDGRTMLYLHEIEVAEQYRRTGIGRALVDAFLATAGDAELAFLITAGNNAPAHALYESAGGRASRSAGGTVSYWWRFN